jgi:hypothetical protein
MQRAGTAGQILFKEDTSGKAGWKAKLGNRGAEENEGRSADSFRKMGQTGVRRDQSAGAGEKGGDF